MHVTSQSPPEMEAIVSRTRAHIRRPAERPSHPRNHETTKDGKHRTKELFVRFVFSCVSCVRVRREIYRLMVSTLFAKLVLNCASARVAGPFNTVPLVLY